MTKFAHLLNKLPVELRSEFDQEWKRERTQLRQKQLDQLLLLSRQLETEISAAHSLMPQDAARVNAEVFLWEEDTREFEALSGLAQLQLELQELIRQQQKEGS